MTPGLLGVLVLWWMCLPRTVHKDFPWTGCAQPGCSSGRTYHQRSSEDLLPGLKMTTAPTPRSPSGGVTQGEPELKMTTARGS